MVNQACQGSQWREGEGILRYNVMKKYKNDWFWLIWTQRIVTERDSLKT